MSNGKLAAALQWVQRTASGGGVPDSELLKRFVAGGDEAAFELLLWRHQRLVFGVCWRLLHNEHDAEDAFQATFLVLARKGRTIRRRDSVAAWLYRVAYRCALTVRARQARREQPLVPDRDVAVADDTAQSAERHELRAILDEELHRLPEQFRVPTLLCYLAGKTVDEAAEQLGCPRGTVASRLARARERLRTRLARRGVVLPAGAATLALSATAASAAPDSLIRAALMNIRIHAADGTARTAAAAVANQVVQAMFLRKLMIGTAALLACAGVLLVAGSLAMQALAQLPDERPRAALPAQAAPAAPAAQAAPKADPAAPQQPAAGLPAQEYVGTLEPIQVIDIRSRITGTVDKVHVQEGDTVKRGALLFEIDARAARLDVEQARANQAAAEAKAKVAISGLERLRRLVENKVVSREELDEREAAVAVARANLEVARVKVAQAQLQLEYTRITAPIDGRISRLKVSAGQVIATDEKAPVLATLSGSHPMEVRFEMDEKTFVRYQELKRAGKVGDMELHIAIAAADENGFPHRGIFRAAMTRWDPKANARVVLVRGVLANPNGELLPGMSVRVRVAFPAPAAPAKR